MSLPPQHQDYKHHTRLFLSSSFKHSFWRSKSGPHTCILSWLPFSFKHLCYSKRGLLSIFFQQSACHTLNFPFLSPCSPPPPSCLAVVYPVISFPFPLQILSLMVFISIRKCLSENSGNLDLHDILSRVVQFTFIYLPNAL